jgi:methylase of polypeptide subunit release factors
VGVTAPVVRAEEHLVLRLREDLAEAGFTGEELTGLWGTEAGDALHRGQRVPALRALRPGRVLDTLARFFVLTLPVGRQELDAALPRLGVGGAIALGLAEPDDAGGGIRPVFDLRPYGFVDAYGVGGWWILSDLGEVALGHALPEDHVLGVGGASTTLSGLMTQAEVGSVLDLGTGCGIQAMHASRHARRVVATDISPRALDIARFNAMLNGLTNIEFRLGNLFEPVDGELFDQIVSNPPFVITPHAEGVPAYEYRDGGMTGDALVETVVRQAALHLAEGGLAQLLGNWEYRRTDGSRADRADGDTTDGDTAEGDTADRGGAAQDGADRDGPSDGLDRVGGWVDTCAVPLDAWVIEREVQDAPRYAETWIRDGGTERGPRFDALYASWLDDFEARGVRAVGFGYLALRRRAEPSETPVLRRLERLAGGLGHNATGLGEHIAATLDRHAWQGARDDAALSLERLVVAPDVTEERHYWPGAEHPTVMTLHQGSGFGRETPLDTALAGFVGACDGELPVGSLLSAVAELLEEDAPALAARLLPGIRELVVTGVLLPHDHR